MAKKANKTKKQLLLAGTVIALALIGLVIYMTQNKNDSSQEKPVTSRNCTTYNGVITEQCAEDYIGLPLSEATEKAQKNGLVPKVVGKNSLDFGSTPIYFEVENDTVTHAYFEHDR